jgi:hypothetical protein
MEQLGASMDSHVGQDVHAHNVFSFATMTILVCIMWGRTRNVYMKLDYDLTIRTPDACLRGGIMHA